MALKWSARRQLLYYGVAFVVLAIVLIAVWETFFTHTPNCFDGVMNGTELGVDCGGACALVCPDDVKPAQVLWARSFSLASSSTYTAAAYIENNNTGAGAKAVHYAFQLFDENNILVVERDGVMDLPPVRTIPIIETGIQAGSRGVARTTFSFSETPSWSTVTEELPSIRLLQENLSADGSRLSVQVENDSAIDASQVVVEAVLFDAQGVARGASKTLLASVPHKSSKSVVFTWPGGIPGIVRAELTVLPSF
ncbi:MAG TPA: hypothetical protein VG753_01950 [Candidatus Paceibacterota bacterium]|nr:hypothetical protein [Candidatus Paceibacterota bacterium]